MYIITGSKTASIKEKQIDAPIQKLFIVGSIPLPKFGMETNRNVGLAIVQLLDEAKLSIEKQTPQGNEPLLLPIGLGSIAEICSNSEGHLNCRQDIWANKLFFELTIELSGHAALESRDGHFLLLSVDMADSSIDSLEVYGVEFPVVGKTYTSYKQMKVNGNTVKSVNLVGKDILALPRKNFVSVDLIYPDHTVTYKKDIKAICQAVENLVMNFVAVDDSLMNLTPESSQVANPNSQTYFDGIQFYTLGVTGVIEARVVYTEDSSIITTEEVQ